MITEDFVKHFRVNSRDIKHDVSATTCHHYHFILMYFTLSLQRYQCCNNFSFDNVAMFSLKRHVFISLLFFPREARAEGPRVARLINLSGRRPALGS